MAVARLLKSSTSYGDICGGTRVWGFVNTADSLLYISLKDSGLTTITTRVMTIQHEISE